MSMRADVELDLGVLEGKGTLTKELVLDFLQRLPWSVQLVAEDADDLADCCTLDADGRGLYLYLTEIHPEELERHVLALSRRVPELLLSVDLYARANTEMTEAGHSLFTLQNGQTGELNGPPPGADEKAEDPRYPVQWWKTVVSNNDTRLGYWAWVWQQKGLYDASR